MISSVARPAIGVSSLSKRPSCCRGRLFVAARRELVELLPREAPLGGDQLRADALRHKAVGVALRHCAERVATRQHARAHRHPAHRLHARGDHDVIRAGDHALCGEADRLLAAAALSVDGRARHRLGKPAPSNAFGRCWRPGHRPGDGARDHVVDLDGVDASAGDEFLQAVGEKVDGQHTQRAAALPFPIGVRTAPTMTASRPAYPAILPPVTPR